MHEQLFIALIPSYEPDTRLIEIVSKLKSNDFSIIVVDDGSGTAYADIFQKVSKYANVISYPQNHGKGYALKIGLKYIFKHFSGKYIVVTMDSDGQHTIEDAKKVCMTSEKNSQTLIVGSRKFDNNVPFRSMAGNTITRCVFSLVTGVKVWDTQSGLRAFDSSLIHKMCEIQGDRYEYEMNVLLSFAKQEIPIKEVEISTVYIDGNSSSHFNPLKDSFKIYYEILKFSASSFISFLIDYGLYSLFLLIMQLYDYKNLVIANVSARVISATVNYTLNRKFVFNSEEGVVNSASKYFILAIFILIGNTLVLKLLSEVLGINTYISKLLTEIIFFFISWTVQKFIIFAKHNRIK